MHPPLRALLPALLVVLPLLTLACGKGEPKTHVVIFLIDTLRADHLGAYGYGRPTSPAIDRLALRGVVFEQAHAVAPWTVPSTVSLMTSRFPCEHGVVIDGQELDARIPTLAERMRDAGFATASFYANPYAGPVTGLHRGFDHHENRVGTDGAAVASWLDGLERDRPFFLYIHNGEPHDPYLASPEIQDRIAAVGEKERRRVNRKLMRYRGLTRVDWANEREPGATDNTDEQRAAMREFDELQPVFRDLYDADVLQADARVESVIAELERRGLMSRTLFILVSDHGEEFGEHAGWQHDQSVYQELLRVPLIVHLPEGREAGRRIAEPVTLLDVFPTVFDAIGRPELAEGVAGASLLPLTRGEARGPDRPAVVGLRMNRKKYYRPARELRGEVNVALRRGRWKAIWNPEPDTLELYDVLADPGETRDLHEQQPELARELRAEAERWLARCYERASAPGTAAPLSDESREGLKALGYIE